MNTVIVIIIFLWKILFEVLENTPRGFIYMFSHMFIFSSALENKISKMDTYHKSLLCIKACYYRVFILYNTTIASLWIIWERSKCAKSQFMIPFWHSIFHKHGEPFCIWLVGIRINNFVLFLVKILIFSSIKPKSLKKAGWY